MQAQSISQRRPKSAYDPYSTPARRRRIIAELAKVVLKGYYKTACRNVDRFRIETAAAIVIQCLIRRHLAYKLVQRLISIKQTNVALAIQTRYRVRLAVKLKRRLLKERYHRRCLQLVTIVEHLWMIRNAKMFRAALLISRQLARAKLEQRSTVLIQRHYRGYQSRRAYKWIKSYHKLLNIRRISCTMVIQRIVRSYLTRCRYQHLRRIRQAAYVITSSFLRFHYKLKQQKRISSAIIIQCRVRSLFARRRYSAMLEANKPLPIIIDSTDIKVELSSYAIKLLKQHSAIFFFHWCLQHGIVYYSKEFGFHLGTVVRQVMSSVQQHLNNLQLESTEPAIDNNKVVTIPSWDLSTKSDDLPVEYQQQVAWSHDLKAVEGGDQLQFIKTEDDLMIVFQSPTVITEDNRSKRRAVQRVQEVRVHLSASSVAKTAAVTERNEDSNILDEAMMHFQNAVVYVPRPVIPPPQPAEVADEIPSVSEAKVLVMDDSLSDSDNDINEPPERMSNTTSITVMLQAPEPPPATKPESPPKPPPINYNNFATRIQRAASLRLQMKHAAVIIIQRMIRRRRVITRWHDIVYFAWEQAYEAVIILQCAVRQHFARRTLKELKRVHDELYFPFGHDFYSSDEVTNWAAFGMTLPPTDTGVQGASSTRCAYLATSASKESGKYCNPPAAELVNMLEIPDMPPGCLFPNSSSSSQQFVAASSNINSSGTDDLQSRLMLSSLMQKLMPSKNEMYIDGELVTIDLPPSLAYGEDQEVTENSAHDLFWSFIEESEEGASHDRQHVEVQSVLHERLISQVYSKLAAHGFSS